MFFEQILKGDPIDGYYGIKGIGPKKAERIIDEAKEMGMPLWDAVCNAYLSNGLTIENALLNARMAHILTAGEYDFKTKTVKLWEPLGNLKCHL